MKTAISIQDDLFDAAEETARRLRISRSELYARAIHEFLTRHSGKNVTERLNRLYSDEGQASAPDKVLTEMQSRSLDAEQWK